MNDLRRQTFGPDLLAHALAHRPGDRSGDRPALHLPDRTVTYADMRDAISQYAQAYTSFGLSQGTAVAVVSSNRAEVLYMVGANSMQGCRPTPLHPMGSLDDHAYVLAHAEIGTLVFDPAFEGRQGARLPPKSVDVVDALPLAPVGKPDKVSLRALLVRTGPTSRLTGCRPDDTIVRAPIGERIET
jgi:acyl-CoA synthetase (AMP-forming)/AMP-acid ligase II